MGKWYSLKGNGGSRRVWSTEGTVAERPLSIWDPSGAKGEGPLCRVSVPVMFGHLACTGSGSPTGCELLGVTDQQESGLFTKRKKDDLHKFLEIFFPHPVRFRKAWSLQNT